MLNQLRSHDMRMAVRAVGPSELVRRFGGARGVHVLLLAMTLGLSASVTETQAQSLLAIRHVVLLDPSTAESSAPSTVLIDADRIVAIGTEGTIEIPAAARQCVQIRQVCSVGVSPTGGGARAP